MDKILRPYDPKMDETFFICKQCNGDKLVCTDYSQLSDFLAKSLFANNCNYHYFIDWTFCNTHPLIFDIDIKDNIEKNTFDILMNYFDVLFSKVLQKHIPLSNFNVLLSMRRDYSGGMHVHFLNVEVTHDDYVHLCNLMQKECECREVGALLTLDCNVNSFCLIACDKKNSTSELYIPVCLVNFCKCETMWEVKKTFDFPNDIVSCMMPIPQKYAIYLQYPTRIIPLVDESVAQFKSCINERKYSIVKENQLVQSKEESPSLQFLKHNAMFIDSFTSGNRALETWYDRFSNKYMQNVGIFSHIDYKLRKTCVHLKEVDSPLKTLLQSQYFLPVFYSLCNLMKNRRDPKRIICEICKHVSIVPEIPTTFPKEYVNLSLDTILYCALKTAPKKEGFYLIFVEAGWDWIFESTLTVQDMIENIKVIQKKILPIAKTEEKIYSWDPSIDKWLPIDKKQIKIIIKYVYDIMKNFKGFSKIPEAVRYELNSQSSWIDSIVNDILSEKIIKGNFEKMTDEIVRNIYGWNVPQYYLFNYEVDSNDDFD